MTVPTITKQKMADAMIIASPNRDAARPHLCAVAHVLPRGREILADDFRDRREAEAWIDAQKKLAPAEEEPAEP